jgi:RNA polymerase sigma factor (sigma-70 family)
VENTKYTIKLNGELVRVSEEVYREYHAMARHARYLEEKDARHGVVSYNALDTDELTGEDAMPDIAAESVEDSVVNAIMLDKLRKCLPRLSDDETEMITALFYLGVSETSYAKEKGLSQQLVSYRKKKTLKKLKKMMTD